MNLNYLGFPVFEVPEEWLTFPEFRQVKFPRRKNKRIQARWRKNKKNWNTVHVRKAFMLGSKIIISHEMANALITTMKIKP